MNISNILKVAVGAVVGDALGFQLFIWMAYVYI